MITLTGHFLTPDKVYVYGVVKNRIFSRYQVSALLQNTKMPKLALPGFNRGFTPSDRNDGLRFIRDLEKNGCILTDEQLRTCHDHQD